MNCPRQSPCTGEDGTPSFVQGQLATGERAGKRVRRLLATALLDRLLHQSTTVNIRGESYRLRHRRQAGLKTGNTKGG